MAIIMLNGCESSTGHDGYIQTGSGLLYKIHHRSGSRKAPAKGDVLSLSLVCTDERDSVLFNSRWDEVPFMVPFLEASYNGDIYEGLAMMFEGDSASFITAADSFLLVTAMMPELPPGITDTARVRLDIRLLRVMSRDEFKAEYARMLQKKNQQLIDARNAEPANIEHFISFFDKDLQADSSGVFRIRIENGDGPEVDYGSQLVLDYSSVFLDGSPARVPSPYGLEDTILFGKQPVLEGLEKGLQGLKQGDSVILVVPSSQAFGRAGIRGIPPYSTLVFHIRILKVNNK